MAKGDLIKLGAFWKRQKLNGEEYLSGSKFDRGRLVMFRNKYKKDDKHPDWILYIGEDRDKEETNEGTGEDVFENPRREEVDDSEVPF